MQRDLARSEVALAFGAGSSCVNVLLAPMTTAVRFPPNDLTSLIDETPVYNLAASYAADLSWRDLESLGAHGVLDDLSIGYGTSRGGEHLRAVIARSVGVTADDVIVTTGSTSALFMSIFLLAGPGDEVVTVTPNFPPTIDAIDAAAATRRLVELSFEEGYRLPLDRLEDALSSRTTLVILVSPGNPSGVSLSDEELRDALAMIANRAPRARVIVDEVYRRATYGAARPVESAAKEHASVMTTESLSKSHGTAGLRVGWLICRDQELRRRLAAAKMGTVIACGTVDEALATLVLEHETRILSARSAHLEQGLGLVERWVTENAGRLQWVRPHAGALCVVRFEPHRYAVDAATDTLRRFRDRGVAVAPGTLFGESPRTFRLGFGAVSPGDLEAALARMTEALDAD
jgi:aspartate/methionine/tyrosine aminotransferase